MSRKKRIGITLAALVAALAVTAFVLLRPKPLDDPALQAALVGKWRALDVENNSLHHRKGDVADEEIAFNADGTLVYRVVRKPGQGDPIVDSYAWQVVRGKLQLRLIREGGTQEAMPRLKVSVYGSKLRVQRHNYPDKIFGRMES